MALRRLRIAGYGSRVVGSRLECRFVVCGNKFGYPRGDRVWCPERPWHCTTVCYAGKVFRYHEPHGWTSHPHPVTTSRISLTRLAPPARPPKRAQRGGNMLQSKKSIRQLVSPFSSGSRAVGRRYQASSPPPPPPLDVGLELGFSFSPSPSHTHIHLQHIPASVYYVRMEQHQPNSRLFSPSTRDREEEKPRHTHAVHAIPGQDITSSQARPDQTGSDQTRPGKTRQIIPVQTKQTTQGKARQGKGKAKAKHGIQGIYSKNPPSPV